MKGPILCLLAAAFCLGGCSSQGKAVTGNSLADADPYARLGLSPSRIEPWEDGMRTTGGPGSYEWWYFDFTFDDGSTAVIVYYTKNITTPQGSLKPFVTFQLNRPDGSSVTRVATAAPAEFSAARDRCNVKIGSSSVAGDLSDYALHVEAQDVRADLSLHRVVPSWRPGTGFLSFEKAGGHFFAWLPSVPQGTVTGIVTVEGGSQQVRGVGYHDHNWGDVSMLDLFHDWYWGRAQVGPYTVIASYITPRTELTTTAVPLFMLARDGAIVAEDSTKVHFAAQDVRVDSFTGKPVANVLIYEFDDGERRYRVTFRREQDLSRTRLIDVLSGFEAFLARLSGFDGAYLRFTGPATVDRLEGEKAVETASERSAVWELMYFGHAPTAGKR
jgi:hypothetical protein